MIICIKIYIISYLNQAINAFTIRIFKTITWKNTRNLIIEYILSLEEERNEGGSWLRFYEDTKMRLQFMKMKNHVYTLYTSYNVYILQELFFYDIYEYNNL